MRVRSQAARSLGRVGSRSAMKALVKAYKSERLPEVRAVICDVMRGFEEKDTQQFLRTAAEGDPDRNVRNVASGRAAAPP